MIKFFKRMMNAMDVAQSLQNSVTLLRQAVDDLAAQRAALPERIRAVAVEAVRKYAEEHPNGGGDGSVDDATLIAAIQSIDDDMRRVHVTTLAIPQFFDNQLANGDPEIADGRKG